MQSTIHFDPKIHQAIKMKSAQTGKTISGLVNEMAHQFLLEDKEDMASFVERKDDLVISYEDFLNSLDL